MSEEKCHNIKSLKTFNIESLCYTCERQLRCAFQLASDLISQLSVSGVRQEHIIVECHLYERLKSWSLSDGKELPNDFPTVGSLRPFLWDASIIDLCPCCPAELKDGCQRHKLLADLASTSLGANTWVQGQVVCCNQTERLYQISEPKK